MNFEESMQAVRAAKQRRAAWIREQVECGHIVPCTKPGDDCGCTAPSQGEEPPPAEQDSQGGEQ